MIGPELAAVARAVGLTHSNEESKESKDSGYDVTAEPSILPGEGSACCKSTDISNDGADDDIVDFDLGDEGARIQGASL